VNESEISDTFYLAYSMHYYSFEGAKNDLLDYLSGKPALHSPV
jgi:hypothetical protein